MKIWSAPLRKIAERPKLVAKLKALIPSPWLGHVAGTPMRFSYDLWRIVENIDRLKVVPALAECRIIVATHEGAIVGWGFAYKEHTSVFVDPAKRHRGVGGAIRARGQHLAATRRQQFRAVQNLLAALPDAV